MKASFRKILVALSTVAMAVCLLFGGLFAFSQTKDVKAASALKTEFTNNGQIVLSQYGNNTLEYVEGIAGSTGAVLKINSNLSAANGTAFVMLSVPSVKASELESIVVRIYSPGYTSADSFRAAIASNGSWIQNEAKDMSNWIDVNLSENAIALMKDADGFLSTPIPVGARVYSGASEYYIDSITVNVKKDYAGEFTNNGQVVFTQYGGNTFEYVEGIEGSTGAVLKIKADGTAFVNLSVPSVKAILLESIVVRIYSPEYTTSDSFRAGLAANGSWVQNEAKDMSNWIDVTLSGNAIALMKDADGFLSTPIPVGARVYSGASEYYIDSITVNMKETVDVSFQAIHGTWNNYAYNDANCTFIQFNGGISGNGNLDADFTELLAKMTINNAPVDTANVSFYCPNWIGASGGIIMRLATNPAAGSVLMLPAGAMFNIGGSDTNVYKISEDVYLKFDGSKWALTEKPSASMPMAQFNAPWSTAGDFNKVSQVLLQYNTDATWTHTDKGDLASKVTYKNSKTGATRAATDADIAGWDGQKWIVFSNLAGYDVLEIAEGGTFGGGVGIPALTIYCVNGYWVTTAPHAATTHFAYIASGWNNNAGNGVSNNIFSFDVKPLGDATDATNLAATYNRTSLMVRYNGKTFAELYADANNANAKKYSISYAHGNQYFYFAIPEADLVDGAIFEIEEGTPFMNNYLGAVKYEFIASKGAWEPYVELEYGTPNFSNATAGLVGAWSWNHQTQNTGVVKDTSYGYTIVADWVIASNATNLAATKNTTSLSITLNGVSFYDLYQGDDGYRLNAQLGYFAFSVPTAALVASNGYEYPTLEIMEGTPFYDGNYLPATTLIYKNGAWQLKTNTNYNPSFVSINAGFNNDAHGFFIIQFNTDGWEQDAVPTSWSGITYNGKDITELATVKFFQEHSIWFTYSKTSEKLAAGYNRYSHPTIKFAEGATVVYNEQTYTFQEMEFYLVNDKWTTEKPAGWTDEMPISVEYTEIKWNNIDYGVGESIGKTNGKVILLAYSELIMDGAGQYSNYDNIITADNDAGNKIKINGVALKDVEGAYVCLHAGYIYINVPACEVLTIEDGAILYEYALSENTFYFNGEWSLTEPTYTTVSCDGLAWNNYDYNGYGMDIGFENQTGIPSNGFCGLIAYNANLGPLNSGGHTTASTDNMATAYMDIGSKFKVNGVAAKDIPGAYIAYAAGKNYVYFYVPFSGLAETDVYTVTIEAGAKFLLTQLPASTFYFYDGTFHDTLSSVVTVQYGDITVTNRFAGEQTIDAAYLADVISDKASSVCPLNWTIAGNTYYAGESVTVNQTTTVVITEVVEFETMYGAAVRITNDGNYGIRFETRIGLNSYLALLEKYGASNVKTGTYIAPKALFDAAGMSIADYFAQEKGEGADSKYVHVSNFDVDKNANGIYNKETYETDGYIQFYGSLTNLNDSNYYTQFFGVGYITLTIGDKTVTVYGLNDIRKTNRTIYDVATMAYSDMEEDYSTDALAVLQQYIDSVAVLTYSNGNLFVDTNVTGREYTSVYTVTENEGVYTITSSVNPKTVVVNGKKVSVAVEVGDGVYTFTLTATYLDENFGSSIRYGMGEPNTNVWGAGTENANDTMLASFAQGMGVTSYRVWVNNNMGSAGPGNVVSLGSAHVNSLKSHVKALVDGGVNEILFSNGKFVMPYDYPTFYVTDAQGNEQWVNSETFNAGGYTLITQDHNAVPNPATEAEAYATWLKVQYDYYVLFAAEVNAWKMEYGWTANDVQFYFEGLNEPEFHNLIHKRGDYRDGDYFKGAYNTAEMAKILTDVSYYMTLALNGCGEVTTPAFTYFSSDSDSTLTNGVFCDTLLDAMYTEINDGVAPTAIAGITPADSNDENDYFTCLNWHPYLPWNKTEHAAMYYGEIVETKTWWGAKKKEAKIANYVDMWAAWNNGMYQIAVNGGDTDKPKVFFSEFGLCDWGNISETADQRYILGINENTAATVFGNLLSNAKKLLFVDELTVMAFRIFDNADLGAGEGNFGFINEEGQLKAIAKEYYQIINGNADTSDLQAVIDKYYK